MKNKVKLSVALLLCSCAAAFAGLFETCVSVPNGGSFPDTCDYNSSGTGCTGSCTKYVISNDKACVSALDVCYGTSNYEVDTYTGSCDFDEDCGCVLPGTPTMNFYPNPC
jgi:hypothetical protein